MLNRKDEEQGFATEEVSNKKKSEALKAKGERIEQLWNTNGHFKHRPKPVRRVPFVWRNYCPGCRNRLSKDSVAKSTAGHGGMVEVFSHFECANCSYETVLRRFG